MTAISTRPRSPTRARPAHRACASPRAVARVLPTLAALPARRRRSCSRAQRRRRRRVARADAPAARSTYVTVAPGDSLWSIAETIAPHADPRDVVDDDHAAQRARRRRRAGRAAARDPASTASTPRRTGADAAGALAWDG